MSERSTTPQATSGTRFDPAVFLETAAKGRIVSMHRKNKSFLRRAMPQMQ